MRHWLAIGCLAMFGAIPGASQAAGIDCGKARSAVEKAICAAPDLLALDRSVADATVERMARQQQTQGQARQELMAWLRHRDATCSVPPAALAQCLSRELTARLVALAPLLRSSRSRPNASLRSRSRAIRLPRRRSSRHA